MKFQLDLGNDKVVMATPVAKVGTKTRRGNTTGGFNKLKN